MSLCKRHNIFTFIYYPMCCQLLTLAAGTKMHFIVQRSVHVADKPHLILDKGFWRWSCLRKTTEKTHARTEGGYWGQAETQADDPLWGSWTLLWVCVRAFVVWIWMRTWLQSCHFSLGKTAIKYYFTKCHTTPLALPEEFGKQSGSQ